MKKTKQSIHRMRFVFCEVLLALTGCVGVVGPGGAYVEGPDVAVFGGYGHGHFDHDAGRRGFESRGAAGHFGHR